MLEKKAQNDNFTDVQTNGPYSKSGSGQWPGNLICPKYYVHRHYKIVTRKSKTEAVLQRRSIMKLGVICKFMNCYGKCFMS